MLWLTLITQPKLITAFRFCRVIGWYFFFRSDVVSLSIYRTRVFDVIFLVANFAETLQKKRGIGGKFSGKSFGQVGLHEAGSDDFMWKL